MKWQYFREVDEVSQNNQSPLLHWLLYGYELPGNRVIYCAAESAGVIAPAPEYDICLLQYGRNPSGGRRFASCLAARVERLQELVITGRYSSANFTGAAWRYLSIDTALLTDPHLAKFGFKDRRDCNCFFIGFSVHQRDRRGVCLRRRIR